MMQAESGLPCIDRGWAVQRLGELRYQMNREMSRRMGKTEFNSKMGVTGFAKASFAVLRIRESMRQTGCSRLAHPRLKPGAKSNRPSGAVILLFFKCFLLIA